MKSKIVNFMVGLGFPLGSIGIGSGCIGLCGNCRMSCTPGIFLILILVYKFMYKKIIMKMEQSNG